ncbi:hypothetical protein D1AOALGA4SA_2984 [Olavius algarvensis Delta 1 endosymbiont]|nr:hypothetical protein D1AOALGA4SA_2984 [Olavius algarvensis Delta 1 endosymbiont]
MPTEFGGHGGPPYASVFCYLYKMSERRELKRYILTPENLYVES